MKQFHTLGALWATTALLAGCESVANIEPPAHTPRLSVAYTLSNQPRTANDQQFFDARNLYVSTSHSITETSAILGRADATAQLLDATGQVVETFRPRGRSGYGSAPGDSLQGYYVPVRGYVGQPGQRYTLQVSAPGLPAIEATLALPAPATVEAGSFAPDPAANQYQFRGRLAFTIADNAAATDYYLAYARLLDAAGQPWGPVQQDYASRNNEGIDLRLNRFDLSEPGNYYRRLPVSDAGRNGQRLSFGADVTAYPYGGTGQPGQLPPAYLEVIVSSIPAETYQFYQSVQRYYDTDGNPFAEPAPLRSNVANGYGLFAGATDTRLRIKL
ncbi:DUF4249 domain-containing protein [Hymenobacter sp. RP-2-7]|uniref:DUF4249 domain-containing protein n=1 Tax=Hymenobacter polaris TaxID=2682546 RepID=A0A7Y0AGH9_9BACT|nr:DUF4249 domain-containing protein [Hymenobacter polaris]NML66907.1 DUF4249 domain-containing protein [Hymenobacter polaris]